MAQQPQLVLEIQFISINFFYLGNFEVSTSVATMAMHCLQDGTIFILQPLYTDLGMDS